MKRFLILMTLIFPITCFSETLESKVFCFGVFSQMRVLNYSFTNANNEYFKRHKKDVSDAMNPILDKIERCAGSGANDSFAIDQCAKKVLSSNQYDLFKKNMSGVLVLRDAHQKRNQTDIEALRFTCSVL